MNSTEPQPISLADAQRIWTLQQQKAPLSPEDQALLHQACEWQMWVSHGIRLPSLKTESPVTDLQMKLKPGVARENVIAAP